MLKKNKMPIHVSAFSPFPTMCLPIKNTTCYSIIIWLNPFPNKPWFSRVCSTSLLKTLWEKEKLLITRNFSFSCRCFLPFRRTFCHFHQLWNCCLQTLSIWKSLKLVVCAKGECPTMPSIWFTSKIRFSLMPFPPKNLIYTWWHCDVF